MHNPSSTAAEPCPTRAPRSTVSRRRILQSTAWSIPAVTLANATPAFASSGARTWVVTSSELTVTGRRCTSVQGKQFTAQVTAGPSSVPSGTSMRIVLPEGLTFTSGDPNVQTIPVTTTSSPAVITIPTFEILGASGTYAVRAELLSAANTTLAQGTLSVAATAEAGVLVSMPKSPSSETQVPTYSPSETVIGEAVKGSTSGNFHGTDHAVIVKAGADVNSGNVVIWGANHPGSSPETPRQLPIINSDFRWRHISSYTSTGLTEYRWPTAFRRRTGGLAAISGTRVVQWFEDAENDVPFTVREVTGVARAVIDLKAVDGHNFVLTADGVYHWTNGPGTGPIQLTRTNLLSGTAGATQISAWGQDGHYFAPSGPRLAGIAVYPVRGLATQAHIGTYRFNGNEAPFFSEISTPTGVIATKVVATSAGIVARTSTGKLIFRGPGHGGVDTIPWNDTQHRWIEPVSTGDGNAALPTDVIDFATWGVGPRLHGGLWIKSDGTVGQWHGDNRWGHSANVTSAPGEPEFSNITKVFAQDGNYMALDASGRTWAWGNNLDHSSYGRPRVTADGAGSTADLNIWGVHHSHNTSNLAARDEFFGGGYAIKAAPSCAVGG